MPIGRFKVRVTKKGSLKGFEEDIKQAKAHPAILFDKLGLKDKFIPAMAKEMKTHIKSGKTFRSLKKSTREIRAQRRARVNRKKAPPVHLSKPLFETGALLKSIHQAKPREWKGKLVDTGITFNKYGAWQANGFIVDNNFRGGSMQKDRGQRMTSEGIAFAEKLKLKQKEGLSLTKSEESFIKQSSVKGKVVPPRDFITVASKKALPDAVIAARVGIKNYWNKRLRTHVITRLHKGEFRDKSGFMKMMQG
tara:strand:+ start:102 stop:851 length:750 start_codon:yes stop_codon:yes gene_type:complete